jgi:hypothetical protein
MTNGLLHDILERMIPPHIRSNLRNHSYIDVHHNSRQALFCYADGYPVPDVQWIRGACCSMFLFSIDRPVMFVIFIVPVFDQYWTRQ